MLKGWGWCWDKRGLKAQDKEGELSVAPGLLAQLDLEGRVVTGDALYAQRALSWQVVAQGGDYFWVLKDNQPTLRSAVALLFTEPPWGEEFDLAQQLDRHGDRQESRQGFNSLKYLPALALSRAGMLCGTDPKAQRGECRGNRLCHHQLDAREGRGKEALRAVAGALEDRKPEPLCTGREHEGGCLPGAHWRSPRSDGSIAQCDYRAVAPDWSN
jgi:predicted transposase YbfD/YdcC